MRKFNCTGPCYPDEHYYIRRDKVMEKVKRMIDEGAYFVVYAPRQMGKTTLLENMLFELERENSDFVGILVDFEIYKSQTPEAFYENFSEKLTEQLFKRCREINHQKADELTKHLASLSTQDVLGFEKYVRTITKIIPEYRLSIVIDEFEGCPDKAMKDFLHMSRSFYLSRKRNENFRNLNFVLIGIRDLTKLTVGTISPFNIAQHLYLENFSMEEVFQLYGQYTQDTRQMFSDEAVSFIYEQTRGQPFLVNRLGVILTEEMDIDKRETITIQHAKEALLRILRETNNNFKTMLVHAKENREAILKIIAGWQLEYNEDNPLVTDLRNYGLIQEEGGVCLVNNPIYQSKILSAFRPTRNEIDQLWRSIEPEILEFENFYSGNVIRMDVLIENFKIFMDRIGLNLFRVTENPQEIVGQFLLASFIDLAITNIGGTTYVEVPTGIGRMDIIALARDKKYIIETKLWTGEKSYQSGLLQIADYMRKESVHEGYYVIFDPNLNGNEKELEKGCYRFDEYVSNAKVTVFIIRIKPKPSSILGL